MPKTRPVCRNLARHEIFAPFMKPMFQFFHRAFSGIPVPIWWLSATQLINRIGTMAIPFMTLYLTQKLSFSIADAGFIMMFFGVGTILGALLGGRLADRIGYRPIMIASLAMSGFGLLALLPLTGFWEISVGVFCLSIVAEAFRPAASISITRYSNSETRMRSFSLYRLAINLGWAVASALGGLLATLDYSLIFWADGLTCLISALFLFFLFKKMPETADSETTSVTQSATGNPDSAADKSVWQDRNYLIFVLLTWLNAMVFMQMIWTVPPFFKEVYHFSEWTIGLVMGLNGLIVCAFEMPIIFTVENKRPTLWFIRFGLVLYFLTYAILGLPLMPMVAAILAISIVSFGETFVMPFSTTFATRRAPVARQGQYLALYTAAYSLSNVLAPLYGTQVIEKFGWTALWWVTAAAAAVCWGGFWFLEKQLSKQSLPKTVLLTKQEGLVEHLN